METNYGRIMLAGSTLMLFSSCNHYYYIPNVQNVPLLKEANEVHMTAAVGTGEYITTADVQGAYALTNNVGMMGSYMHASATGGKGDYYDLGMGYFNPIGEKGLFEVYGGAAYSNQSHTYEQPNIKNFKPQSSQQFTKLFIQPAIGIATNPFDAVFSVRFSQMQFTSLRIYDDTGKEMEVDKWDGLTLNEPIYLFEPAVTIRAGWKYFKMQSQLQLAIPMDGQVYPFEMFNYSIGLSFDIARRFWEGNKAKETLN